WREEIINFYGEGADEELFCIPTMGSGTWLSAPLIEARMSEEGQTLSLELPGSFLQLPELERAQLIAPFMDELEAVLADLDQSLLYAFGFDFARVADLSVGTLLSIDKVLRRREALTIELRNVPGDEQKMIVRTILQAVSR